MDIFFGDYEWIGCKIDLNGDNSGITSPLVENRYGGGFPQRYCVDKACLVSTVVAISEMATITDNPRNNTRHVVTTGDNCGIASGSVQSISVRYIPNIVETPKLVVSTKTFCFFPSPVSFLLSPFFLPLNPPIQNVNGVTVQGPCNAPAREVPRCHSRIPGALQQDVSRRGRCRHLCAGAVKDKTNLIPRSCAMAETDNQELSPPARLWL
ncbi:hypothetical protein JWG39_09565 [Desulforhopalus vacuolatus]|uniref:hypothetical protein n=1 Tax=Desulforhopalus vacuolatus TaxID=40414 RepID=UPI001963891A|nr:hypothetical protein [Desulforhopalus vacuolatus]MBM9520060.1 hypothetical protein [Desulforhopalus vacuolatus]